MTEQFDWEMVNMIKGKMNKKSIDYVTDKEKWKRRSAHEKEFFNVDVKDKVW